MLVKFQETYNKFPKPFWVLTLATFIDRVGGTLIFPFFSLYITEKFGVGMTEAGGLLAIFSLSGMIGSLIGGAIADKFGRRSMIIFGLIFSALSSVSMGLVNSLGIFYGLAVFVGLLSNIAEPARQAQIADLVDEDKRSEAFGIMRVVGNLAWMIGPTIGGLMAARSYLALFVIDAILSLIVAYIYFRKIPETKPAITETASKALSLIDTLKEYRFVLKDKYFNIFIINSILMNYVYLQLYGILSVYLRDTHGLEPKFYGMIMSLNATFVVILQIWVSSKTSKKPPMMMMALGSMIYAIAYPIFGLASTFSWFIVATLLIALGEMVVMPVSSALAAKFAPEEMRGRYMALFGWGWQIPSIAGPIIAGFIFDNLTPSLLWISSGGVALIATIGFYRLHFKTQKRFDNQTQETLSTPSTKIV